MVMFTDKLAPEAPRKTSTGFLVVRARAARSGVYRYAGYEVDPQNAHGLRDRAVVNVLRDENTVFDKAAVQSFIGKPITDDHPSEPVTAANWRQHARGTIMGALRDGEYLAFDLLITDAEAIRKVEEGKRELSNGYQADLEFGDFTAPDGTICDARQSKITGGNHCALVDAARGGSLCRIGDASPASTADEIACAIAQARHAHELQHAYLGDAAPAFDEAAARAAALAATNAPETPATAVTDAEINAAYAKMVSDQVNAWKRPQTAQEVVA